MAREPVGLGTADWVQPHPSWGALPRRCPRRVSCGLGHGWDRPATFKTFEPTFDNIMTSLGWMTWIAVFVGGGLGSVMRLGTGQLLAAFLPQESHWFPWGVLSANLLATGLLAWCLVAGGGIWGKSSPMWWFMTVGVCGGFSTFSAFAWDTMRLWQQGGWFVAGVNVVVSVGGCLFVGWWVSKTFETS